MSISSSVEKIKDLKITLKPLKSVLDCNDEIVTFMIPNTHGLFSESRDYDETDLERAGLESFGSDSRFRGNILGTIQRWFGSHLRLQ